MFPIGRLLHTPEAVPAAPLAALQDLLSDAEIEALCRQLGHRWRRRRLPPAATVRSLLYRSLSPDRSIRAVLADLAAAGALVPDPLEPDAPSDAAWCQARDRLPQRLWDELLRRSAQRLDRLAGPDHRLRGRPLYIADGSTFSMPDTPDLVAAFGYAPTKHGPSRFPVARLTLLVHAGVQAVAAYALGDYREAEDAQFHRLWDRLPDGCICLLDRHFASFYNLAKLAQRGIGVVTRLHQRRNAQRLIRQGRRLGPDEWLVPLDLAPQLRRRYDDPSLPQRLWVRLIRVTFLRGHRRHTLWLVTTLMDRRRFPAALIADLYRRRWEIETRLADLKTTLAMNVLRSRTAAGIRGEVVATLLAANLLWTVMHQAARAAGLPADRLSFVGAARTVLAFSAALRTASPARRPAVYAAMLRHVARRPNRRRPGRVEPRLLKREPVRFAYLRISRAKARQQCLS